jgi:hypothetical protein
VALALDERVHVLGVEPVEVLVLGPMTKGAERDMKWNMPWPPTLRCIEMPLPSPASPPSGLPLK